MNILWVVSGFPYPPDQGVHRVNYKRIEELASRGHTVHLLSAVEHKPPAEYLEHVSKVCADVFLYEHSSSYDEKLRGLVQSPLMPDCFARMNAPAVHKYVDSLSSELDVIVSEQPFTSAYLDGSETATVLSEHNIEYRIKFDCARVATPGAPVDAGWNFLEAIRTWYQERRLFGDDAINGYVFLSKQEHEFATKQFSLDETLFAPVGVDTNRFDTNENQPDVYPNTPVVVFVGYMTYPPNVDAATWFTKDIFPRIRETVPDAQFYIVGKSPHPAVEQLRDVPGVTVTGHVDVVEPYVKQADVAAVPLRTGGGVKIKLLEALASETPTVTTLKGLEGTAVEPGEHALVADDSRTFADRVVELLTSSPQQAEIGAAGRRYVREYHDWATIGKRLEAFLARLA